MSMNYKYILFFLCVSSLITSVNADDSLTKNSLDKELIVQPEALLLKAVENIRDNNTELALKNLSQLVKTNPDFNAAQLMYADLMLARSQAITDFGNIANISFERITALRDEVQVRWRNYISPVDRKMIPSSLVKLARNQGHVIVIDTSSSRLFLFKNQKGVPTLIKDLYVTIGKNGAGKYVEGDQKTPVGVYFVTDFISPEELPDLYGDGAFPIDYPNVWDQRHGRTGYGIWLHGTPSKIFSRPPEDSNGCVIVSNQDLNALLPYVKKGNTAVIISDLIDWITKQEWKKRRGNYSLFVETWRRDWESRNVELYLRHYSKKYSGLGKDYNSWVEYKRRINPSKKFIKVNITDKSIFLYPGEYQLMVVTFVQDYASDNFRRKFTKQQYWRMEDDGRWRIIYEGVVS